MASFENRGDAEMAAKRIRQRRRSSLRRIGVGYHELD